MARSGRKWAASVMAITSTNAIAIHLRQATRLSRARTGSVVLEHDPEKHTLGPRPDGWVPVFPRDKREAFARRSCSNKKIERDDDSKKSHPALARLLDLANGRKRHHGDARRRNVVV